MLISHSDFAAKPKFILRIPFYLFFLWSSSSLCVLEEIPMLDLVLGFVLGAAGIILGEALCILYLWNRLLKKSNSRIVLKESSSNQLDHQQSFAFVSSRQGIVWVLEPDKASKLWSEDKAQREQKSKKEILEVCPVKKYAKIDDHSLILTDPDGSQATIHLLGCTVLSVSATNLSSKKWAKRYPIKVESEGSRTLYLYFETSWEKESWCKSLRLASSVNKEKANWYAKLSEEFQDYLTSMRAGYHSFMKPSAGCEPSDRLPRTDVASSKVRLFLKKLAKKTSKGGLENKVGGSSSSVYEERKMAEKFRLSQDSHATGSTKSTLTEKTTNSNMGENTVLPLLSSFTGSQTQVSGTNAGDSDDKVSIDEGTLCWNLLVSRLFFDAKRSADIKSSIQGRIQRTLSNLRTPSYVRGVTCTNLDVGALPPHINSMRVLPIDMNEVWAMEIDVEYSGGFVLDIETRLEVREAEFMGGIVNASTDSASVDEVTSDLLEGFEHFGNQLKLSGEMVEEIQKRDEGDNKCDAMKKGNNWTASYLSRWNCILSSIANQVSQVPLSLAIKVASVRGTLRLHIKPPPSDQLWFGFVSMPEMDFNLESSVGEQKISSTHVALLLGNRFKEAIRETLVLPNCEGVCIPWMLAEKDDWIPRKVAPFIWVNQETSTDPMGSKVSSLQPAELKSKHEANKVPKQHNLESKCENPKNVANMHQSTHEPVEVLGSSSECGERDATPPCSINSSTGTADLETPLLSNELDERSSSSRFESPDNQVGIESGLRSISEREKLIHNGDDGNPKRMGRKARMLDIGKKMGEKLEEKRRHIEEKSRNIVEKMRGP